MLPHFWEKSFSGITCPFLLGETAPEQCKNSGCVYSGWWRSWWANEELTIIIFPMSLASRNPCVSGFYFMPFFASWLAWPCWTVELINHGVVDVSTCDSKGNIIWATGNKCHHPPLVCSFSVEIFWEFFKGRWMIWMPIAWKGCGAFVWVDLIHLLWCFEPCFDSTELFLHKLLWVRWMNMSFVLETKHCISSPLSSNDK